jgi:hypothetical protein
VKRPNPRRIRTIRREEQDGQELQSTVRYSQREWMTSMACNGELENRHVFTVGELMSSGMFLR